MMVLMNGQTGDVISSNDVSVAFLQAAEFGESDERFVSYKAYKNSVEHLLRLYGPLYGQRCASKRWYLTMAAWLCDNGFDQAKNEPCLFVNSVTGMRVVLYVDDLLCRGPMSESLKFHDLLESRFECGKDSRNFVTPENGIDYCGLYISMSVDDGVTKYHVDQNDTMLEFLVEAGQEDGPVHSSPMPSTDILKSDSTLLEGAAVTRYKRLLGMLHYFVRGTRWDIAATVSFLSQFNSNPTVGAMSALEYLCGYLRGTMDFKLTVTRGNAPDMFHFYVDAAHLSPRSQTGVLILMNGVPVHWRSNRQASCADSPAVAEIYGLKDGVKDARLFMWVAEEMGLRVQYPFIVQVDSKQAISFQQDTCPRSRIRGSIDIRDAWVEELRDLKVLTTQHVWSEDNLADLFTKPLKGPVFRKLVERILNFQNSEILGGHVYLSNFR
jgi:hypothetical protein